MTKVKVTSSDPKQKIRPALDPEVREQQLANLAYNLAEQQLRDGTASSQVITHFLKAATAKATLEKEKLRKENILLEAKAEAIESQKRSEEMFAEAIKAMKDYTGKGDPDDYDEY